MDYIQGFNDAVEMLVMTTNNAINELGQTNGDKSDLYNALDKFVAITYILQLKARTFEDEYVACLECEERERCEDYNKDLEYDEDYSFFDFVRDMTEALNETLEAMEGEDE